MDPPRSKTRKAKKKRSGKKRAPHPEPFYDLRHHSMVPHMHDPFYSDDESSFDEVNLSDAECPVINENDEDSNDEETVIKRLFKGPRKCQCCTNWVKHPTQGVVEPKAKEEKSPKHAITARYASVKKDLRVTTSIHSIAVHSKHIKDVLREALDGYPGINVGRKDANFYPPFKPLVHVWGEIEKSIDGLEGEAREHGNAFHEIIEPEIGEILKDRDDLLSRGMISYELLWTIYKPGERVFCDINGTRHLLEIATTKEESSSFCVSLDYWDVGLPIPVRKAWTEYIYPFPGAKKILELGAVPFGLYPGAEAAFEKLMERGRKIRAMPRGGLQWFKGFVTSPSKIFEETTKTWIEGRMIVDAEEYDKKNTDRDVYVMPDPQSPPILDVHKVNPFDGVESGDSLTNGQLAMARSVVRGFSLTTKGWHEFEVDDLSDVRWNDSAFDQLVMQSRRKRLIKALVDSNQGRDTGFDDFIKGKGQGLIMLLCGRPGTGKTLTAESIAERIHLPLYSVHSSELSNPNEPGATIETKLSEILHRASHWNAVLLIDEADAFMEKRDLFDMERNQRVAIFLRLLELYSGVLILTTNRRISFDPAFYSRIHLTLKFDDLDHSARSSVWKNFLRSIPNNVHEGDIAKLAEAKLNGRQIKNLVKMGSLLAYSEKATLCMEHLETMLETVDDIPEEEFIEPDEVPPVLEE